jgi:hypothetical protein
MSVIMNKTIIALFVFTPFPTFPHGGRSTLKGFSPLGETGKGVIQRKSLNINIKNKFIPF